MPDVPIELWLLLRLLCGDRFIFLRPGMYELGKEPAESIVLVKGDKNYSEILEVGATDAISTVML